MPRTYKALLRRDDVVVISRHETAIVYAKELELPKDALTGNSRVETRKLVTHPCDSDVGF